MTNLANHFQFDVFRRSLLTFSSRSIGVVGAAKVKGVSEEKKPHIKLKGVGLLFPLRGLRIRHL